MVMLPERQFDYLYTIRVESEKLRARSRSLAIVGPRAPSAGLVFTPVFWRPALVAGLILASGLWLVRERAHAVAPVLNFLTQTMEWMAPQGGVSVEAVSARLVTLEDKSTLVVEGTLANQGLASAASGDLRIALVGSDRVERYVWTTHPSQTRLAGGERVKFAARLESPPAGVVDAVVSVVAAGR